MTVQLAAFAHASIAQLRETIRRVTTAHGGGEDQRDAAGFLAGVEVSDSSWADWEETSFDVRQLHA